MTLDQTPVFISENGLSQRLAISPVTLTKRIRARRIEPDALMLTARGPFKLFALSRLGTLRSALLSK